GVLERGAAVPEAGLAGVAGAGGGALAEVGRDPDGVRNEPAQGALGLGTLETALVGADEPAGPGVQLAGDVGVGPAVGEVDQGVAVGLPLGGAQQPGAVPHPVLALGLVERVHVQQHVPVGIVRAVGVQGGAAPQPSLVLRIGPEVVQEVAAL